MVNIVEKMKNGESFLLANDGQYLGKLSLNQFDVESIFNKFGVYGSQFSSTSIFNKFGVYGSQFSALSPNNKFTSTPPKIYFRGREHCFLTENKFLRMNSIAPDQLVEWLKFNNLNY
jgi:hypothetical protein